MTCRVSKNINKINTYLLKIKNLYVKKIQKSWFFKKKNMYFGWNNIFYEDVIEDYNQWIKTINQMKCLIKRYT
jgi:hypothetical protein